MPFSNPTTSAYDFRSLINSQKRGAQGIRDAPLLSNYGATDGPKVLEWGIKLEICGH